MVHKLVDILFPPQCASCSEPGSGLCERCVPLDLPTVEHELATLRVRALGTYDGALRRAVLAVKDGRRDVADALASRVACMVPPDALLVPVCTTAARRRVRGIDGVERIARRAATLTGTRASNALERLSGDAQRGRSGEERRAARGRFRCDATLVAGREVVLIDDVCTTGTTLEDCAEALRAAGARVSQALVAAVARTGGDGTSPTGEVRSTRWAKSASC